MLKTVLIVAVVLIAAILIHAVTKPDTFRIQRSAVIAAPPEKIFAVINDHHQWGAWSPWEKPDPAMKRTYSGAASGKGAIYEWDGNNQIGAGRSEIVDSVPPSKITMTLDMIRPFEAHNMVEFTLNPKDGSTNVSWAMHGPQPYMMKVMSIIMNSDKMVGGQFETGLGNLKTLAEK
jgi:uncharacterized protein YndB with AHSA1/START domain